MTTVKTKDGVTYINGVDRDALVELLGLEGGTLAYEALKLSKAAAEQARVAREDYEELVREHVREQWRNRIGFNYRFGPAIIIGEERTQARATSRPKQSLANFWEDMENGGFSR